MKQEELTVNPQEFGLETEQVLSIEQAFLPKIQEREALSTIYQQLITSEITPELCKEAKALRLKLLKVRTGISDIHKTQKAFFLSAGRFVDAWKNKETIPVEQMEETLYDIELYYVKIENERIAKIEEERICNVKKYTDFPAQNLGSMEEGVFNSYLAGLKIAYEAKIESEKQAEIERVEAETKEQLKKDRKEMLLSYWDFVDQIHKNDLSALNPFEFSELLNSAKSLKESHEAEQIRIKMENERLKRESEQNKKVLAEELAKAEAERKVLEEKAQKELEDREKELQAAIDKAEKLEAEKLEEELEKERIEAEKRAENMRLQEEAVELEKAPRKVKLTNWVLSFNIQEFSEQDDEVAANIREKFNGFKVWAKKEIDNIK